MFYVWFDAPIGYISITKDLLGEDYVKWWKKSTTSDSNNKDDKNIDV